MVGTGGAFNDLGNEVWQSESTANGQGYSPSNLYQPTSTSGATYHAGTNNSNNCPIYGDDSSLCNGTTAGVTTSSGAIPSPYIYPTVPRGTTWDAGAYQLGAGLLQG